MSTRLKKIISTVLVTLATLLVVGHNLVPHHHDMTPCTEIFTSPCFAGNHSCSHASCDSHGTPQLGTHHHDHSICTEVMEYLSSEKAPLSHVLTLVTAPADVDPPLVEDTSGSKIRVPATVPLFYERYLGTLSRRGPPAC